MGTSRLFTAAAAAAIALTVAPPALAEPAPKPGQLITVAGIADSGYGGDGGDARQARIGTEVDVAVLPDGTVYIADEYNEVLRVVGTDGVINSVSVAGEPDFHSTPVSVVVTGGGLYVATRNDVRRMNPDGSFTVLAGGGDKSFDIDGTGGDGGDGGPATEARLFIGDLAVAGDGTLYLADRTDNRIRRVTPDGTITTIAGGGVGGALLEDPRHVAVDSSGNAYFVDAQVRAVQKVAPDGTISTALGQRTEEGFAGDGGPAANATFGAVGGITTDDNGNLYVADTLNGNVRVIDKSGVIDTIGPSVNALRDVVVGPGGDLYLSGDARVVRLVRGAAEPPAGAKVRPGPARWRDQDPGTVLPVAGAGREMTSAEEFGGEVGSMTVGKDGTVYYTSPGENNVFAIGNDGRTAVEAQLRSPEALAADQDGNVYVAEVYKNQIRKIDAAGKITTIAGTGEDVSDLDDVPIGDGGPATAAHVRPESLATGPDGSVYVADGLAGDRIRKIDPRGTITTVVGGGERHITEATLGTEVDLGTDIVSIAVDANGTLYVIAFGNQVFAVGPSGAVSLVAGTRGDGFSGDGGPAVQAKLNWPRGLAVGPDGTRYLADTRNNRVRAVRADGTITTVAGTGARADDGDRGPATEAALEEPERVAVDAAGDIYVTTAGGTRIRKIDGKGTIHTVARVGLVIDEDATKTVLGSPSAIGVDAAGTVYAGGQALVLAATADGKAREFADVTSAGALATGPDGSVYLVNRDRVERVYPDGAMVTVVGGGASWVPRDGPPPVPDGMRATSCVLEPADVAVGPAGELYVTAGSRVYRLNRDGTLKSIVDIKGVAGLAIAVRHDGVLYVADRDSNRVYSVRDGKVHPFAGNGSSGSLDDRGDGDPATEAPVGHPTDLAVDRDGTVYIATGDGIRRVVPDGDIDTVVEPIATRDGHEVDASAIALDPHGNLYFTSSELHQVRVVVLPGELPPPFSWTALWLGLAVVAAVGAGMFGVFRLKGPRPAP